MDAAWTVEPIHRRHVQLEASLEPHEPFVLDTAIPDTLAYALQYNTVCTEIIREIGLFRYNEPPKRKRINNFTKYAIALIGAIMNVQENQHLHSDDWQRTIYINTLDVETTDFELSDEKKDALVQSGIDGAETYFRWFEDATEAPVNRIPVMES